MKLNASKLIFQGGLMFVAIKNGRPNKIRYSSGVYVTANTVSVINQYFSVLLPSH